MILFDHLTFALSGLHAKLAEVNTTAGKPLVRVLPGLAAVQAWIEEAKQLEPMLTY
jgi:hypothetical protein